MPEKNARGPDFLMLSSPHIFDSSSIKSIVQLYYVAIVENRNLLL